MALLDFLKKKKDAEKSKQPAKKAEPILDKKESSSVVRTTGSKQKTTFAYNIVREPHISEKGTILGEASKYVFNVYATANKPEIKKAVEGIYGVDVMAVNVITVPHKKRRLGRTEGFKKGFRKAIVTIKEGQKIELF